MKKLLVFCLTLFFFASFGQRVGINTSTPHSSSALEIFGDDKGFLMPRVSINQRNNIPNPAEGLMVYNLTDSCFSYFNGVTWRNIADTLFSAGSGVRDSIEGIVVPFEYGDTVFAGDAVAVGDGLSSYNYSSGGGTHAWGLSPSSYVVQIFRTNIKTKYISAMECIINYGNYSTITLSVRKVSNGLPVGQDINGETASYYWANASSGYGSKLRLAFNNPVPVEPDSLYALVVTGTGGAIWRGTSSTYSEGSLCFSNDSGATWSILPDDDFWFKAFEIVTEPGKVYQAQPAVPLSKTLAPNYTNTKLQPVVSTPGDIMKNFVGIALEDGLPGEIHPVQISGVYSGLSGMSVGSLCRLGAASGSATTLGNYQIIGMAIDSTKVLIRPEY